MIKSKLFKTLPVALGLVGLLGCDTPNDVKIAEYSFDNGRSRVEILKNVRRTMEDYYTINVYDSKGDLICSIADGYLGSDDLFVRKNPSDSTRSLVTGTTLKLE